ncbi:Gfo/Idh/MocA family oxidoreductase [Melissococcus plutonius]|uniref:Oxidoreductase, GfoIdhMocA family n=1 Tax=Melissococcus plutonius TaxID=33970 RepID=A0A2Z5Y3A0_9ENTE|nr:Gfo/Idh/MocA family oxidoreductase [Melissococcus plutonius]BAL62372.1 Gfo/Idh/MocA family oxidoreductase [Melissococcus plutonius DAT561]MCV2498141.1 Gfo/Idh/MocA family oxidoreductase [Melissococcus plutonius]MCV2501466.1 Gfo/Idh/MocA family oxidoreductase [Melissococcus plutonius]MCV2504307.1 Gfo/Idh/MocA family oxidoreductase [Melissococcus plutonius]MCV2506756.1 Gfo/Idh/MocA family oxidoreductase [Melissococcus plutonius]
MIHLGVIGTNWITRQFVEAALATNKYDLTAIYSRKLETAQKFGENYDNVEYAIELNVFLKIDHMDTVYIASPNSLHFEQAKQAILAKKNVIVEKPAFSTPSEMKEIIELAKENHVYFFEAARNIHEKGFKKITELLPLKDRIYGASFTLMQYSSRYDKVIDGEEPNVFSPHFSGGALMDLGVYLVYAALSWFGMPKTCKYTAYKIRTGVDGMGTAILCYDHFNVTLQLGKIVDSFIGSEIYFDNGTLSLDGIASIGVAEYYDRERQERDQISIEPEVNPMTEEAEDFAAVIGNVDDSNWQVYYEEWLMLARNVNQVLTDLRKDAGIVFDADKNNEV